jgi:H/ACA ribonucleoprotein complex subunit 4
MKPISDLLNFSLINIDKPTGPTSYSISEFVKHQLKLKKTSHMGTLDPKVTGVLPITLERACKLAGYFITHDKTYIGILHTHKEQNIKELQKIIDDKFVGKILQTPPNRSAVKVEEREREVYHWKLTEASEDKRDFLFECKVQGGTYIRKLCSDLGEIIGGAHMGELRRTEAGIFSEKEIHTLPEFESAIKEYKNGNEEPLKKMLVPAEDAIKKVLPVVNIEKKAIKSLYVGKPLFRDNITSDTEEIKTDDRFAVFQGKQFIGIYRRTTEQLIFGRSEFVFN